MEMGEAVAKMNRLREGNRWEKSEVEERLLVTLEGWGRGAGISTGSWGKMNKEIKLLTHLAIFQA